MLADTLVKARGADGIYAILDLQWTAPGNLPADGSREVPDDHSPAFWTSVATTFLDNPAVLFDAFNEPNTVPWSCWRDGGCQVPDGREGDTDPSQTYTAVGMQAIVDAIRATGASQPILLAGVAHANDLSGWLANMPSDPDGHLAASFYVYQPNACVTTSCWDSTVAPVAAVVPTTTLEFRAGLLADLRQQPHELGRRARHRLPGLGLVHPHKALPVAVSHQRLERHPGGAQRHRPA
jgi:hypothetical protein